MGKRSNFERMPRDFYPTPYKAVLPLLPHLSDKFTFTEPCAGDGSLINHLEKNGGICISASDIFPKREDISQKDYKKVNTVLSDYIITNPPWSRSILHSMIIHFSDLSDTWLLFDADWIHTKQSIDYLPRLKKIVSIGRVIWFGTTTGKDNCCWYNFSKVPTDTIEFIGRN